MTKNEFEITKKYLKEHFNLLDLQNEILFKLGELISKDFFKINSKKNNLVSLKSSKELLTKEVLGNIFILNDDSVLDKAYITDYFNSTYNIPDIKFFSLNNFIDFFSFNFSEELSKDNEEHIKLTQNLSKYFKNFLKTQNFIKAENVYFRIIAMEEVIDIEENYPLEEEEVYIANFLLRLKKENAYYQLIDNKKIFLDKEDSIYNKTMSSFYEDIFVEKNHFLSSEFPQVNDTSEDVPFNILFLFFSIKYLPIENKENHKSIEDTFKSYLNYFDDDTFDDFLDLIEENEFFDEEDTFSHEEDNLYSKELTLTDKENFVSEQQIVLHDFLRDNNSTVKNLIDKIFLSNNYTKIITLTNSKTGKNQMFDIDILPNGSYFVGYHPSHMISFCHQLINITSSDGVIVVREFTPLGYTKKVNGKDIRIPFKNVYMIEYQDSKFRPVPYKEVKYAYSIDHETGKKLKHEKGITYIKVPFTI